MCIQLYKSWPGFLLSGGGGLILYLNITLREEISVNMKYIINFIKYIICINRANLVGNDITTPKTPLGYASDTNTSSNKDNNLGSAFLQANRVYINFTKSVVFRWSRILVYSREENVQSPQC